MLAIKSDAHLTIRKLERMPRAIQRANLKATRDILHWGQRYARSKAPSATGDLKSGIGIRDIKRKGKVISGALVSTVTKNYPYQKWVNETIPTVTLPTVFPWPRGENRGKWNTRKWRYRYTIKSGTPGYFRKTYVEMVKKAPGLFNPKLKTELKIALR